MNEQGVRESIQSLRNRCSHLEREGDYWTSEEKDHLRAMFHEGIGISEMAIRLQRTEPAVIQQIEKMDLYRRKAWPKRRKRAIKLLSATVPPVKLPRVHIPAILLILKFRRCPNARRI